MRIADLLRKKGSAVATVTPETTVTALLAGLAEHNVGAMVVVSPEGSIAGIVSERDVVRRLNEHGPVLGDGRVAGSGSFGDVVKNRMEQLEKSQEQLEAYISQG